MVTIFSNLSGFVKEKHAYGNNDDIEKEQFLLFSNQSLLCYIEKTQDRYSSFAELIIHEDVRLSDFREFQLIDIQWLIEHDILVVTKINEEFCLKEQRIIEN